MAIVCIEGGQGGPASFQARHALTCSHLYFVDGDDLPGAFALRYIPHNTVIDHKGVVLKNGDGVNLTDEGYFRGLAEAAAAEAGAGVMQAALDRQQSDEEQAEFTSLCATLHEAPTSDACEAALAGMLAFLKGHPEMFQEEDDDKRKALKSNMTKAAMTARTRVGHAAWPKALFGMVIKAM